MSHSKSVGSAAIKVVGNSSPVTATSSTVKPATPTVPEYLEHAKSCSLLRFATAGSVDDGKSTLVGRLLHDTDNILDDHLEALQRRAKKEGSTALSLALVTDGLKAEREQGITIDVAYRYFSTKNRRFILADTPGHEQYTRNMATGCSTADLMIILVDARHGVVTQTRRHAFIGALLGVPRFLIAVNKMDLVEYSEETFNQIRRDFSEFAAKLRIKELRFIPISALLGDNVVTASDKMPWYHGETVMEHLESVYIGGDANLIDFRFPVQIVLRPNQDYRGYAGQIASGELRVGEEVVVLPSLQRSRVKSIDVYAKEASKVGLNRAVAPMSVSITLADNVDVSRGSMLARPNNIPNITNSFEAMLVWASDEPFSKDVEYIVRHTTKSTKCAVSAIRYRIDVNTLGRESVDELKANDVGRVQIETKDPLMLDSYDRNRSTGSFVLVDPRSFNTVAAGMVLDRHTADQFATLGSKRANSLHFESGAVTRAQREELLGAKAVTFWLTGLSGSGKSTIAVELERTLFASGRAVFRLDGDNLRHGLNKDLGFSAEDRKENIRRTAEAAKILNEAGISVICALISPMAEDRQMARDIVGLESFCEVFVSTPLEVCKERDPHGLYKRAIAGELANFTGVSAPYEAPENPYLVIDTSKLSLSEAVNLIISQQAK